MRRLPLRSPPRMRGKAFHRFWHHRGQGITPAYAGKRRRRWASGSQDRDHPCVCGEKSANPKVRDTMEGASPRMRGKGMDGAVGIIVGGITPAYAGKRAPALCRPPCRRDHPRVCGEKDSRLTLSVVVAGSPPRMRGKASGWQAVRSRPRDHPRVCGEKLAVF